MFSFHIFIPLKHSTDFIFFWKALETYFFNSIKLFQYNWNTVIPFVIFPPKSDDFTDFCEVENDNGQQKMFENYLENFI